MRRPPRNLLRLATLAALLASALTAYLLDAHYKHWPDNGLALQGATLTLATNDFPAFWRDTLNTTAGHDIAQALSRQINDLERSTRLATGIRLTPLRCSLWLGNQLLVTHNDSHWLACLRPGLLFHFVHRALLTTGQLPVKDGIETYGGLSFGWHDGYLLLGPDPATIRAHVSSETLTTDSREPSLSLQITDHVAENDRNVNSREGGWLYWYHHKLHATFTVLAKEELPVEIAIRDLEDKIDAIPPIPGGYGKPIPDALIDEFAQDPYLQGQVERLLNDCLNAVPPLQPLLALHRHNLERLSSRLRPAYEPREQGPFRWVLFDLDASDLPPIPRVGTNQYAKKGSWERHPLLNEGGTLTTPYEWDGIEGFLAPYFSADFNLGCAIRGSWAYTATQPKYLPPLLVDADSPLETPPAFSLHANCKVLSERIATTLQHALSEGLYDHTPREFDGIYKPWLDAFAALGPIELVSVGNLTEQTLQVRGFLAKTTGSQ